jgi:hypothetical protein
MSIADVLNNPAAHAALVAFKRSKPWRGTVEERLLKFEMLSAALAGAYGLPVPEIRPCLIDAGSAGKGGYNVEHNLIVLTGRLSVVTFLRCLARARGKTLREACAWSLNVFKHFFPVSFARCRQVGPRLVRGSPGHRLQGAALGAWLDTCSVEEREQYQIERYTMMLLLQRSTELA